MKDNLRCPAAYDHSISGLFIALLIALLITLGLAVLFYAEPFIFMQHAFSDLASTTSKHGLPNSISMTIYALGMLIGGSIMLRIAAIYARSPNLSHPVIKSRLAWLASIGFIVSIYPNDLNHTLHSIGVGVVLGALYFFTTIFHFELKDEISTRAFVFNMTLLQAAVFSYAAAFFLNTAAKQSLQKFCLLGVMITLERVVTMTEDSYSPLELRSFLDRFQH